MDVDGDGRADYLVTGADLNNDGIPDALQQPFQVSKYSLEQHRLSSVCMSSVLHCHSDSGVYMTGTLIGICWSRACNATLSQLFRLISSTVPNSDAAAVSTEDCSLFIFLCIVVHAHLETEFDKSNDGLCVVLQSAASRISRSYDRGAFGEPTMTAEQEQVIDRLDAHSCIF